MIFHRLSQQPQVSAEFSEQFDNGLAVNPVKVDLTIQNHQGVSVKQHLQQIGYEF